MKKAKKKKASYKKTQQKRKAQKNLRQKRRQPQKNKSVLAQSAIRSSSISLSNTQIKQSASHPLYEILLSDNWKQNGLAYIWLARRTPLAFIVGIYLVDIKCLGLKSTFVEVCRTEEEYTTFKTATQESLASSFTFKKCSYDLANSIIYGGIAYAQQFDFQPHKDFQLSQYVVGEKLASLRHIRFGEKDGKPLFINGPDDDVALVLEKLTKAAGKDGFQFMLQTPPEEG
ncbi:MAG: hypothetical protein ACREHC_06510 [Candidatus Levyibacteriota bacterium]